MEKKTLKKNHFHERDFSETKKYIQDSGKRVVRHLEKYVLSVRRKHPGLADAVAHTLGSGKKIRPALCFAACESVGGDTRLAMPAACAIEMIHTYSLIHDDLPSMDDDSTRRGLPSTHKLFGETKAILAGDLLLADSFGFLTFEGRTVKIPDRALVEMVCVISSAAGKEGMAVGQMMDLEHERGEKKWKISAIHSLKTAALIEAAVKCGAIAGGADGERIKPLAKYAGEVGLAFQTLDDIIDSPETQRRTDARKKVRKLTEKSLRELEDFDGDKQKLEDVALMLCERTV